MGKLYSGHFEADGGAHNLELGFVPHILRLYNTEAVAGEIFKIEWFGSEMGDAAEIQHTVLADNGSTGNLSIDFAATGGNLASYNSVNEGIRYITTFDDTGGASEDLITFSRALGNPFEDGEKVRVGAGSGGTLPTNLAATTNYFVIDSTASTCRISATLGGSAVDFGSDGSGSLFMVSQDNFERSGFQGVTIAAAFMGDGDEIYWEAHMSDHDTDLGDIA